MGAGAAETTVTPDLLKECGFTHLLDWPVDDQPIWMRTRSGPILSVPYPMELNDAGTLAVRHHTGREFADMIVDQFEELLEAYGKAAACLLASLARLYSGSTDAAAAPEAGDQTLYTTQACRSGLVRTCWRYREVLL